MIWLKYFIIGTLFFVFSLLQASFFPYFIIMGAVPNLVFTLFFIIIFFEHSHRHALLMGTAIIAGIISDMFLGSPFGVCISAFLIIHFLYLFIGHFLRDSQSDHLIFYFVGMFSTLFLVYYGLLYLLGIFFPFESGFGATTFIGLAYSLVFALVGFYLGRKLFSKDFNNQLKLL